MAVAGAMVVVAADTQAVSLSMGAPVQVADGWMRATGHYDSGAAEPTFQVVARCGPASSDVQVLYGIHVVPAGGRALGRPAGHAGPSRGGRCRLRDARAIARDDRRHEGRRERAAPATRGRLDEPGRRRGQAGSPVPEPKRRFRLNGQKYTSPVGARSEAGVAMSLGSHVSIQLNYARTAQVPMMGYSSDNGILARLRFGF